MNTAGDPYEEAAPAKPRRFIFGRRPLAEKKKEDSSAGRADIQKH
jgi:hypothetical protein